MLYDKKMPTLADKISEKHEDGEKTELKKKEKTKVVRKKVKKTHGKTKK